MHLKGWEFYVASGLPVSGATVNAYEASETAAPGALVDSTVTNAEGRWEFATLPDSGNYDIKVTSATGRVKWLKGLSRHNIELAYNDGTQPFPDNKLWNGGFEEWAEGTSNNLVPGGVSQVGVAGWAASSGAGDAGTISREAAIVMGDSRYSAKAAYTKAAGPLRIYQEFLTSQPLAFYALRGKVVTFTVQVRQGVANNVVAYIDDGAETVGASSATTGSYVTLTATKTIGAAAASIRVGVKVAGTDTIYVDNAIIDIGSGTPTYRPTISDERLRRFGDYMQGNLVFQAGKLDLATTGNADKMLLSGSGANAYGFGMQASELVAYIPAAGATFKVRRGGYGGVGSEVWDDGNTTDRVTTAKILNLNVTTAKIADLNVTTAKIADLNVTTAKIANANVTDAKLADAKLSLASGGVVVGNTTYNGVLTAAADFNANTGVNSSGAGFGAHYVLSGAGVNIYGFGLQAGELQAIVPAGTHFYLRRGGTAGVQSTIVDTGQAGVITTAMLGNTQVTQGKLANASVGTLQLIDANVTQAKMANNSVGTAQIIDANVTQPKLANNSVGTNQIIDANVTLAKMAGNSVDASKIVDGSVGTSELAANAVIPGKIKLSGAKVSVGNGNVNHDTVTTVLYDNEIRDTDAMWAAGDASKIYAQTSGWFRAIMSARFASNVDGKDFFVRILKNGATTIATRQYSSGSAQNLEIEANVEFSMNAGDYIQGQVYQNTGGVVVVSSELTLSYVSAF